MGDEREPGQVRGKRNLSLYRQSSFHKHAAVLVLLSSVLHIKAVEGSLYESVIVAIISGTVHTLDVLHRAPRGLNQQSTAMFFLGDPSRCREEIIPPLA